MARRTRSAQLRDSTVWPRKAALGQDELDRSFDKLQTMEMTHGQTLWILSEFGFDAGATPKTFNYYITSLRRLGIPFLRGESGLKSGRLAKYSFNHLMELNVALSLRVYAILPDIVLGGLILYRKELYEYYRKSYLESQVGMGAPIIVSVEGCNNPFTMSGVYIDLQLTYSAGQLLSIGPPVILTPFEALARFAKTESPARAHPPLNLSQTALRLAELMARAPNFSRGPKPRLTAPENLDEDERVHRETSRVLS
jgi:hypothetical protein